MLDGVGRYWYWYYISLSSLFFFLSQSTMRALNSRATGRVTFKIEEGRSS